MKMIGMFSPALVIIIVATLTGCMTEEDGQRAPRVGEHNSELAVGTAKQHCVASAVPQSKAGATPTTANVESARCFDTFPEAIAAATEGRVQLPPSGTPQTISKQILNHNTATSNSTFVVGIEFADANFNGATLTITSDVTCDSFDLLLASMPSGWNDVISSAEAFSDCNHSIHFENINFGGASVDCQTECGFIGGAMNDRTSSIRWTN